MKTNLHRSNRLTRSWRAIFKRSTPRHDPLLSLSITVFNFSTGWDRLLQKQQQWGA